jgi:hypothetical protein
MSEKGKVDWFANDVSLAVEGVSAEVLTALAFQGEALAKRNIQANGQIDTGFMLNSTYGIGPTADHRAQAEAEARAVAEKEMAQPPDLEEGEAGIHAAAEYAVYQEMAQSFLYKALEELAGQAEGVIREVARGGLGDD